MRQERFLFGFKVLKKFLHKQQEFCFAALNLNDAIGREEGTITPELTIYLFQDSKNAGSAEISNGGVEEGRAEGR